MFFSDALTLDAPRRTADGYLAVRARAARTGVYQYTGREVDPDNAHGLRDQAIVNVLRDEATVFDEAAVRSFLGKPVTDDHPSEPVTAANWRDHGRGVIMNALRDGEHLAFDLLLMDGPTVDKVEKGKRQLSNGYSATLEFGDFKAPDGTACQARQAQIRDGNHVAIVDLARGGGTCRIGDAKPCASAPQSFLDSLQPKEKPVKTMLIDGLTVDVSNADTAMANIQTLIAARDEARTKLADAETRNATLTAESTTKDAKITTLEQQVKDAKPTAAQLRDAGKALLLAADKAKALGVTVTDEMDADQIMAATVNAKMGDKAKGWTADQIAASFAVLTVDTATTDTGVQPIGSPRPINDGVAGVTAARNAWLADKQNAHRASANT